MGPEVVAVTLCFLAFFAMVLGIVYLRSRENMAMIEKGMNPRQSSRSTPKPFISLKYGLLLMGMGLGLFIARMIDVNTRHKIMTTNGDFYYEDNPAVYFALIGLGGGLGLVISYLIEKKHLIDKGYQD